MSHCPSEDWDRYYNEQDEAAAAYVTFYHVQRDNIVRVVAAMITAGAPFGSVEDQTALIDQAGKIVQGVYYRGEDPF